MPLNTHLVSLLQRLQRGLSSVELVHIPHELWPHPRPSTINIHPTSHRPLRLSVFDSSFNPPTLAHLAIANSPLPRLSNACANGRVVPPNEESQWSDCDAKLLLLSIRNADKSLKSTDATFLQRIEMVILLAGDIIRYDEDGMPTRDGNVAVAIIGEPRFVDKSSTLLTFIRLRLAELASLPRRSTSSSYTALPAATSPPLNPQLTFFQGFDTLERLVSPRYYSSEEDMLRSLRRFFSPDGDDSRVVCVRRAQQSTCISDRLQDDAQRGLESMELSVTEQQTLGLAEEFVQTGCITLIDIGNDERTISSSKIREKIHRGDETWRRLTTESIANYVAAQKLYVTSA